MVGQINYIEIEASDTERWLTFSISSDTRRPARQNTTANPLRSSQPTPTARYSKSTTVEGEEVPGINHIAYSHDDLNELAKELDKQDVDSIVGPYDVEETGRTILNFCGSDGRCFQTG